MKIVGIDMTQSAKPCSLVILDDSPEIKDVYELKDDEKIAKICTGANIVAIDSPLFLPAGFCCLEQTCTCQSISDKKGRECERQLSKRHIPSYYSTKKSFIKDMIYRSMKLATTLARMGLEVIEIYPHASSIILFGKLPKKTTPEGLKVLINKMKESVKRTDKIKTHDQADALLGAYTGWLKIHGEAEPIGTREEGYLWIPKLD